VFEVKLKMDTSLKEQEFLNRLNHALGYWFHGYMDGFEIVECVQVRDDD
jgi:hypothetical protein